MIVRKREYFTLSPTLESERFTLSSRSNHYEYQLCKKTRTDQTHYGMPSEWSFRLSMVQGTWHSSGTFYNWVSKLRKAGYVIPDSESRNCAIPNKQEVVKLSLVEQEGSAPVMVEQNASHPILSSTPCIAAEIDCGNIRIRLFNGADTLVIQNTLKCFGGISHAW